jgi:hypothetical protein
MTDIHNIYDAPLATKILKILTEGDSAVPEDRVSDLLQASGIDPGLPLVHTLQQR